MIPKPNSRTTKTLVLSLGKVLTSISSILLAMVLVRVFSKSEWATYRQTHLVYTMAAPILGLGLARSIMFFLPSEKSRRRGILIEALVPLAICGIGFFLFINFGGNDWIAGLWDNPMLSNTLLIMAPMAVFMLIASCVSPSMIATDRVITAAVYSIAMGLSLAILTCIAVLIMPTVEAALTARIIGMAILFFIALFLFRKHFKSGTPTRKGIGLQLSYGIPLGISTMVGVLSRNVDRMMVSSYCDLEDFAIFDTGAMELPLVGVITGSMTAILLVDYRVMLVEGRENEILPLLHRAIAKSGSVLIPAMCFLLCLAPEFIVTLYDEQYRESASIFRIYLLLLPIRTLVFSSIALAAGRTKSLTAVPIVSVLVNVVLNYYAIKYFGYIGCAWATVITIYFISAYGRALIAQSVLNCSLAEFIPWRQLGLLIAVSSAAVPVILLAKWQMTNLLPVISLLVCFAIYMSITVPLLVKAGFVHPQDIRRFLFKRKDPSKQ